jgi:hypothetical protein
VDGGVLAGRLLARGCGRTRLRRYTFQVTPWIAKAIAR